MSNDLLLTAETRTDLGKGASRRLRREEDKVPGIVYGANKDALPITLKHNEVLKFLEQEAAFSQIITLTVDGKKEKVVLRDLQRHVYKPKIQHMDLMRIKANEKLTMHIPLHFTGEEQAPGIIAGGVASHTMTDLEVLCLPKNLPEFIEIDVSKLDMDQAIHLSEIALPTGVELKTELSEELDPAVVSIHMPKEEVEPTEEEETTEEASDDASSSDDDDDSEKESTDK